jgi:hypothetical protein
VFGIAKRGNRDIAKTSTAEMVEKADWLVMTRAFFSTVDSWLKPCS